MVGDAIGGSADSMKLEKKGKDAEGGIDELDGSKDGEMVGDAVDGCDRIKLEKNG